MKTWKRAFKDAVVVGTIAGFTSLAAMVLRSRAESRTPWASVNAPSQWVWGDKALRQDGTSWRYTATGFLVHQVSAGFWALLQETFAGSDDAPRPLSALARDAALTAALAAWVDLRVVPQRLSPGFQNRLSVPSLVLVYALFGSGLVLARVLLHARRQGAP